jgi:hypothetical protein
MTPFVGLYLRLTPRIALRRNSYVETLAGFLPDCQLRAPQFCGGARKFHQPKPTPQNSGTTQGLIAVSPVNSRVVWASGAAVRSSCST